MVAPTASLAILATHTIKVVQNEIDCLGHLACRHCPCLAIAPASRNTATSYPKGHRGTTEGRPQGDALSKLRRTSKPTWVRPLKGNARRKGVSNTQQLPAMANELEVQSARCRRTGSSASALQAGRSVWATQAGLTTARIGTRFQGPREWGRRAVFWLVRLGAPMTLHELGTSGSRCASQDIFH